MLCVLCTYATRSWTERANCYMYFYVDTPRQLEAMSHMSLSHVAVHIKILSSTVFFIRFIVLPFTRTSVFYLVGDILVILFTHLVE